MSSQDIQFDLTPDELAMSFIKDRQEQAYFKNFFLGNPEDNEIGIDSLPALFFILTTSDYEQGATATDNVTHELLIRAVINRRTFQDEGSWDTAFDRKKLQFLVQGNINGQLDPNSILGILRTNFTMAGYATNQKIHTEYGGVTDLLANEITRECQIKLTVERLQLSLKT